jgi:tRNA A37 threonylcarbamoyladenosine synthetase subunit TsaC/SUA5/YrdC
MSPEQAAARVVETMRDGGLGVVPFDVAYAFLGATRGAIERIFALKLRPGSKPCPMLATWAHFENATAAAPARVKAVRKVADAGLPVGIVTSVDWKSDVAKSVPGDARDLLAKDNKLAMFINMGGLSDLLLARADEVGIRLFGSSANISGTGNSFRLDEVPEAMLDLVDITCEAATCRYANTERMASSIVDVDAGTFIREGIVARDIARLMGIRETPAGGETGGC